MAARLSPKHDALTREKIRTTQLVKRVEGFALSEPDPQTGKPIQMSDAQVRAALGLLKKSLPDLSSTQIEGSDEKPILHQIEHIIVRAKERE